MTYQEWVQSPQTLKSYESYKKSLIPGQKAKPIDAWANEHIANMDKTFPTWNRPTDVPATAGEGDWYGTGQTTKSNYDAAPKTNTNTSGSNKKNVGSSGTNANTNTAGANTNAGNTPTATNAPSGGSFNDLVKQDNANVNTPLQPGGAGGAVAGQGTINGTPFQTSGGMTVGNTTPTGGTGFNALTPGQTGAPGVATTSITPLTPPTLGGAGGVGGGTAGVGGKPTYTQLLARYQAEHPGQPAPTGDAFNAWAADNGITEWTDDGGQGPNVYSQGTNPDNNYSQNQNAQQTGQFSTVGQTNTAQNQVTGQNTSNNQQTNQNTTGTTTGQTNQTQQTNTGFTEGVNQTGSTQGQTTTGVTDTLGFGKLLQGQAGQAKAADATRQGFLTDLVQTGGSAFGGQVDQAVRNSLTGPQMTGAGDSARARASGYAAAQIARQNTDQRLNAAGQLAGPTATQTLVSAGNPYLGQTQSTSTKTSNTGTTTGTGFQNLVNNVASNQQTNQNQNTNTSGSTAATGFNNLTGSQSESQAGSAAGQSAQSASGQIPQAQTVNTGGGGCIICTVGIEHGLWTHKRVLRKVVRHKLQNRWPRFRNAARGYFLAFTPLAVVALANRKIARLFHPIARAVVYEELRIAGVRLRFRPVPWALHWTWHAVCSGLGRLPWAKDMVTDPRILRIAEKHKVLFQVGGK